ncbi:divergent polysaccharide deacetylase family protein [Moellerella wisconsensis]
MFICRPHKLVTVVMLFIISFSASAARLAIVIDDFGYRVKEDNQILALPIGVSIAILPDSPHGQQIAQKAYQQGREILIHMPMKPLSKQPLEKNTLAPSMSSDEVNRIIRKAISQVPHAKGMNNHMGSEMTSSLPGMINVMRALSHYNLYFLDSVTIGNTQAGKAASQFAVPNVRRNFFLDNTQSEAETNAQLNKAIAYARKHGSAIAIGHPHPSTVRALQKQLPQLPADIELVAVSALFTPGITHHIIPEKKVDLSTKNQPPTEKTTQKPMEKIQHQLKQCAVSIDSETRQGIDFLMFITEAIYQDPQLQPLLKDHNPPLFNVTSKNK